MAPGKDHNYHRVRAKDELERARQASDPSIAKIHRQLAALHRRRMLEIVHLGEPQVDPRPLIGHRPLQQDMA